MEVCDSLGFIRIVLKSPAAIVDDGAQVGEAIEVAIDKGLVDEFPETFGGLKLGAVRGQMDEPQAFWEGQARFGVPASIVENKNDGAALTRADLPGKGVEKLLEERFGDAVGYIPDGFAGRRRDEGRHIQPFITVMAQGDGALAFWRPDTAQNRLQADPVLVGGKDFDRPFGVFCLFFTDRIGKLFLNAATSSGVADRG